MNQSQILKLTLVFLILVFTSLQHSNAQLSFAINKSSNVTTVPSGQTFTYTIAYSISGTGIANNVTITDNVPPELDVLNTLPSSVVPSWTISGTPVTFNLGNLGPTSGTVQINVRFKPGITCNNKLACNNATIQATGNSGAKSNDVCVTATAAVKFTIEKLYYSGNVINGSTTYWIFIKNPNGGDIGGLNLTNLVLKDSMPNGAVVTGATGNFSTYSQIGNAVTLTGPTTLTVQPGQAYYGTLVTVTYPSSQFSIGQTVCDTATLCYKTPCNNNVQTMSDTACVSLVAPNPQGSLSKWLTVNPYFWGGNQYLPSFTPGCCGDYLVYFFNQGNVPLINLKITDSLPKEEKIKQVWTWCPAATLVNLEYVKYDKIAGTWSPFLTAPGYPFTSVSTQTIVSNPYGSGTHDFGLNSNEYVTQLRWTYSTVASADYIYNHVQFEILPANFLTNAPVIVGQNITNNVNAIASNLPLISAVHTKAIEPSGPKISALKLQVPNCPSVNGNSNYGPYLPGQTARWRIAVSNIGNQNANLCLITDNLPTYLTYAGNPTYYYGALFSPPTQYYPGCSGFSLTPPAQIGTMTSTPSIGNQNLVWNFSVLPFRCDGLLDYFIIEFDVKIADTPIMAPAGNYPNTFNFNAANYPLGMISNVATLTVNAIYQMTCSKLVKKATDPVTSYASTANVPVGTNADYMLTINNTGNIALTNIRILDILPHIGDIKVLPNYAIRGSLFDMPTTGLSVSPTPFAILYNQNINSKNPTRTNLFNCVSSDPVGAIAGTWLGTPLSTYSFQLNYGTLLTIPAAGSVSIFFSVPVSPNTQVGLTACNSYAVEAKGINSSTPLCPVEPAPACVKADSAKGCECGKWRSLTLGNNGTSAQQLSCGKSFDVKCNTQYTLNGTYVCSSQSCTANYVVSITSPSLVTTTQSFTNVISGNLTFNQNGNWLVTILVYCGNTICDTCKLTFNVQGCVCDCGRWEFTSLNSSVQGQTISQPIDCGKGYNAICNKPYSLVGNYICSGVCNATYDVLLLNPSGNPVLNTTGNTTLNTPIIFTTSGNYTLFITVHCGNNVCAKCEIQFKVECPPLDCCGKWESNLTLTSGNIKFPVKCGDIINLKCKVNYTLLGNYICKDTCRPKYVVTVYNPDGTTTVNTYTTLSVPVNFTQNGTYAMLITVYCGNTICDECKIIFRVIDCECICGKWKDLQYTFSGPLIKTYPQPLKCGSTIDANCKYSYNIIGTYICNTNCPATYVITMTDPNGITSTQSQSGSINYAPLFTISGNYTVLIVVYCGGKICDECKIIFKVDCGEVKKCCPGQWTQLTLINPAVSNIPLKCNGQFKIVCDLQYTFNASYSCPANCTPTYVLSITRPDGTTGTNTYTSTSISQVINFNLNGLYTVNISVQCGTEKCEECKLFILCDKQGGVTKDYDGKFIKIFPNPSNSNTYLQLPDNFNNYLIQLVDITGKEVYTKKFTGDNIMLTNLLPAGSYVVIVTGNGKRYIDSWIKDK